MRGLDALNTGAFDRRLDPDLKNPIAVGFSGGGDSLAALLMAKVWADRHGRALLVLNVDHRLQPESAAWSRFAADVARRLGADFRALSWDGPKPAGGLAAAARMARHGLMAEAARDAGARVLVFGHTADDVLEGDLMRSEGSRLGALREWSPSPVWPQGRGVFLLRPLLGERRARIRQALREAGEVWIDDPANTDPRSPRARARAQVRLRDAEEPNVGQGSDGALADLARSVAIAPEGFLRIEREALRRAPAGAGRRLLAAGVVCAGGGMRPPRGDRLDRIHALSQGSAPFQATLCGCKIIAADDLILARDAGEVGRGGLAAVALRPNVAETWDGRFELTAQQGGLTARALAGAMAGLDKTHRRAVQNLPAPIRPSLPVVTSSDAAPVCPILACDARVRISSLIAARFLAACGAISKEPAT